MSLTKIKKSASYLPLIIFGLLIASFLAVVPKDSAEAWSPSDCGVINNANEHSYAGLVVRLYVSVNGGTSERLPGWRVSDMDVNIATVGRTASPPGNIVELDGSGGERSRLHDRNFRPDQGGDCDGMVALRGTPGHWSVDCDISKNGDAQQIRVSSANPSYIPNGYRDSSSYRQGSWDANEGDIKRPPNGGSVVYDLTYRVSTLPPHAKAKASWSINGQTSVVDNKTLVRRGESVKFNHQFNLSPTWWPDPSPVRNKPSCTSNSTTCRNRWTVYNQYVEDKKAADTVNDMNEKTARNTNTNHPLYIKKNWVLWDRNKQLKLFGSWGGENIVNDGVGGGRAIPYQVSVTSSSFNSSTVQNILAAGDSYCEYTNTTMKDYQVSYLDGNTSETDGRGLWFPGACVTVRSEWGISGNNGGGNQNIERTDNNGVASRGVGEVVPPDVTRNGDHTFSDVWVNEKYRINGWIVNNGPEFSDEPITVRTQVTDNVVGGVFDPANSFTSGYNISPGAEMSPRLGYDILSGNRPVPADAAGKGVCQRTFWNSAFGDPNPNFNGNTPLACVYVPYFYHIKNPTLSREGSSGPMQQGDSVLLKATARLPQTSDGSGPGADNNGRHHSVSENVGWAIERSDDGGAWNAVAGHSGNRVWQPNNAVETINNPALPAISGDDTRNMPIGKEICFRLRIDKGSQDTGSIYSNPTCYTITKSPKIQVGNRDVLTGYGIPTGADDSVCTTNPDSSVIATGAPSYVLSSASYANKNPYGSWGEYGVFATGEITNFGSAAYDSSQSGAGKLRFSNKDSNGGYRSYGNPCTFNWFEKVGKKTSEVSGSGVKDLKINDPINSGNQINYKGNVDVTAPGTIQTLGEDASLRNIRVSINAKNISTGFYANGENGCPNLKVTVENSSSVYDDTSTPPASWCSSSNPSGGTREFSFVLNEGRYNPGKIRVEYINDAVRSASDDRDIAINYITVSRQSDGTSATVYAKDVNKNQRLSNSGNECLNDSLSITSGLLAFRQDKAQSGWCYGLEILELENYLAPTTSSTPAGKVSNITSPPLITTTIPVWLPASGSKKATVIYAKNTRPTCDGSEGVINIKDNINYDTTAGYNIEEIPRVILLADCGIIIGKDVTNVDASLITRGIINTCSARQSSDIPLGVVAADYKLTKDDCSKPLKVTGHVLAKKINLLRTYGADLTSLTGDPTTPAEDFTQNPIDFISTYRQSYQEIKLVPENETSLPPRY